MYSKVTNLTGRKTRKCKQNLLITETYVKPVTLNTYPSLQQDIPPYKTSILQRQFAWTNKIWRHHSGCPHFRRNFYGPILFILSDCHCGLCKLNIRLMHLKRLGTWTLFLIPKIGIMFIEIMIIPVNGIACLHYS